MTTPSASNPPHVDRSASREAPHDAVHGEVATAAANPFRGRREQPWLIRLTHWINVPVLAIMAMSGLQILIAYPFLGPRGQLATWWPLQGWRPPEWARLGDWLAGARHIHFAFAWILVANAAVYLAYFFARGEWRRRAFLPRRDARHALQMALHYFFRRKEPASTGLYNGLQRLGYTASIVLAALEVLSGIALYKPVQLRWLAALFGGYDGARAVHLVVLFALVGFVIGHVIMVALHPRSFVAMITGGKRDE